MQELDALRPRDILNPGLFEMFRQLQADRMMARLPASYQRAEVRRDILASYDDRAAAMLLPGLFGVGEPGPGAVAQQ